MIESNIINWIDLGDSIQYLDVYGKKKIVKIFNLMRVLISYKNFPIFLFLVFKFFFFLQILMLTTINVEKEDDNTITVLKYISKVIFIQEIVDNKNSYKIAIIAVSCLTLITIGCLIYLIFSIRIGKFYTSFPISLFNIINIVLLNYLIGPIMQISFMSTNCKKGVHKFLDVKCFKNIEHLLMFGASVINLIFYLVLSITLSIYYNEIGSINEDKVCSRINCNYEIYMNICKILMFIFSYFVQYYSDGKKIYVTILQIYIFFNSLLFSVYVYRYVLFFDEKMNLIIQYGWVFVTYFAFIMVMKTLLDIEDTTIFHILGWIILAFTLYYINDYRKEYLLTDINILDSKSLKEIELYIQTLLNLMNQRSVKSKTIIIGIIKKFEEIMKSSPDLTEKFTKLSTNNHLRKKFNSNNALPILSIIYLIYDHHLDKSALKNDIVLNMCYFLMNKIKNPTYAISLCSKLKLSSHKHLYFKYVLMEEIKDYLVNKLSKSNNKESIKHVQICSVILYNIYMDLFKIKIYDAACNQIDYFDILKNNVSTPKTTENFLKIGEDILRLRKEILKLWEKIVELNPFSDESEKDYMLYLETIIQDEVLARTESKKYSTLKTNKLSERNNIYHSMFIQDLSSILLVDGYSNNNKILYTTPNFPGLFSFNNKEILNMTIDDLLPNVIHNFHKELIDDAIKFSNLNYTFKTQRDFLLKGKNNGIFNIKLFVKCIPNLAYGLIYIVYITKIQDHNFILILDKDFKINGFTEMGSSGASFTMNNNYGLTQGLHGHHIGLILPEILLQMEYKDEKFIIPKSEIDLKGNLYPVSAWKELDNKIDMILEKIKQNGKIQCDDEVKNSTADFDDLVNDVSAKYSKPFSVFYKVVTKRFLDGKYYYHRVYLTNDLIALNENSKSFPSGMKSASEKDANNGDLKMSTIQNESKISGKQIKLKVGSTNIEANEAPLDGKNDENANENNKNAINNKVNENNNNKNEDLNQNNNEENNLMKPPSNSPSSVHTKSSIDSAGFNKLKNGILEKKEISSIKLMKYLCFLFGITTIGLIVINNIQIQNNFSNLCDYLTQNLYFNHSKIAVSCVYLSTLNLKWEKDEYIKEINCNLRGKNCTVLYSGLLATCIKDIKTEKENSSIFYDDFKEILAMTKQIDLELFNLTSIDKLTIDVDNLLNLLIANGLKLNANLGAYFETTYNIYDINVENLLIQSRDYINSNQIDGFNQNEKKDKINSQFYLIPMALICIIVIFILIVLAFGYLIFRLNDMEKFFLDKLIKFRSPNFDIYLKRLEDLKKKLRNDTGEEEEKANGDLEMGDMNSKKNSKKDEDGKKKKKDSDDEEKEGKKKRKKGGSKQSKIAQQRNKKKKIMAKFFFRWNLFFTFKVMGVLVVSITYYLVIMLVEKKKKNDYLSFDTTTNSIENIYKSSWDIFLKFKMELYEFENVLIEKQNAIKNFENNTINNITIKIKDKNITCNSKEEVENLGNYTMTIPSSNEITTPKLGNLLMPLINDLDSNSGSTNMLNDLYNKDACAILFKDEENITICNEFWNGILNKGMEQSITQMSVIINTVIDNLILVNNYNNTTKEGMTFDELIEVNSSWSSYEEFVEYYLFLSYMKTVEIFAEFRESKLNGTKKTFKTILYAYIVGSVLLFFVMIYFVYSSKYVFNSFLNFIGILPVTYLMEDDGLYKDILKLEQSIF